MRNISIAAFLTTSCLIGLFAWWFQLDLMWSAIYAALSVVLVGLVPITYARLGFARRDQLKIIAAKEKQNYERILASIHNVSNSLHEIGEVEASKQSDRLLGMVDDYHEIITQRFNDSPLSIRNHVAIAQKVQNIVAQNLADVVVIARSVSGIDQNDLAHSNAGMGGDAAIDRRVELAREQRSKMDQIIDSNRTMLTALAETIVDVANIQKVGEGEHDKALERLRELADRAKTFQV